MQAKSFLLWAVLAALWGSSFLAIGVAVESYSPALLVLGRMAIGAFILAIVLYVGGGSFSLGARGWAIAVVVGLSGNVLPFLLISYAEQQVDTGLAALIMGIAPIITLALAPLMHHEEHLSVTKVFGGIAGFLGVAILVAPGVSQGAVGALLPQAALVGAAFCYASTALFSRKYPHNDPLQMAAASVLTGLIFMGGFVVLSGEAVDMPNLLDPASLAVIYLGVGPTALAALIYFYLIPRIGAARLQQVNYVVPVLGTLLGIALLGEEPVWTTWLALPLIMCGVYLVTRKDRRKTGLSDPAEETVVQGAK